MDLFVYVYGFGFALILCLLYDLWLFLAGLCLRFRCGLLLNLVCLPQLICVTLF